MILDIPFPLLTYEEAPLIARFEHTLVNQQLNTLVKVTPVVEFEAHEVFSKSINLSEKIVGSGIRRNNLLVKLAIT